MCYSITETSVFFTCVKISEARYTYMYIQCSKSAKNRNVSIPIKCIILYNLYVFTELDNCLTLNYGVLQITL